MSLRRMLIETFNKEFEDLGEYFIDEVFPSTNPSERIDFFSDYDVQKISDLFGIKIKAFKTEDELLDILKMLIEDGYSRLITQKKHGLFHIPAFIYFLKHNSTRSTEFYELCMKVHLSKDKRALFAGEGLRKLKVPFTTRSADMLEMVLLAPNFSADLRTVINLLDYIDYEKFVNGDANSEYLEALKIAENDLFAYVSFLASDSLLDEYYQNRSGDTRDYKYSKYNFTKAGMKLMSFFIDTNIYEYKNKYYQFRELENRLTSETDLEKRKNNMMVAFTYRKYPSNDFYDKFSDVTLTMDDLVNFIKRYEEAGNCLLPRQVENLLLGFRNRYLEVNGLTDEFHNLVSSVRETFREYRENRYAFFPDTFIRYYNSKYPNNNFRSFNFGKSSSLTRDIYEMIINDNVLVGYSDLFNTNSVREYIVDKKIQTPTVKTDNDKYLLMKKTYDKYYAALAEQHFLSEFTIDYFIRKNVDSEDMELFFDLKNWFDSYCSVGWDYSKTVKERTFYQLESDFNEELRNSSFSKRFDILRNYNEYAVNDGVGEFMTPRYFYKPLHVYEKEFIEVNGMDLFIRVMGAYSRGENLISLLDEIGLGIEDINLVFGSMGPEFSVKSAMLRRKAVEDSKHLEEEEKKEAKEEYDQESLSLFNKFLEDTKSYSIKEFCANNGIPVWSFSRIRRLLSENNELQAAYDAKLEELKVGRNGSKGECVKEIFDEFLYGVKKSDGTVRPFTYLDFRLRTDMPVRQFVKIVTREFGDDIELKKFGRMHQDLITFNEENVLAEKYVIMVDGKQHEVTQEEKQAALDFINVMELPHEVKLYSLVIRAALNGDFVLCNSDNEKAKVYVKEEKSVN